MTLEDAERLAELGIKYDLIQLRIRSISTDDERFNIYIEASKALSEATLGIFSKYLPSTSDGKKVRYVDRLERTQDLIGEAYQVVGALAMKLPDHPEITRVLDVLSEGEGSLLPFDISSIGDHEPTELVPAVKKFGNFTFADYAKIGSVLLVGTVHGHDDKFIQLMGEDGILKHIPVTSPFSPEKFPTTLVGKYIQVTCGIDDSKSLVSIERIDIQPIQRGAL